jgi:hypothetical protein
VTAPADSVASLAADVRRAAVLLSVAAIVAAAGCGSDSSDEQPPEPRHAEDADPLPNLPPGWKPYLNRGGGFAVGLTPGWQASRDGSGSLIRSFDRLAAVSISPDRTPDAEDLGLDEFATRALRALPDVSRPSGPRPYDHHYDAVESNYVVTDGDSGVEQRNSLIVIRRDHLVTFTVLIASNADPRARPAEQLARKVVATLRSQPPSA